MLVSLCNNELRIIDGYLHRESIKEIVGHRYDAQEKIWYVPLLQSNINLLNLFGAEIDDSLKEFNPPPSIVTQNAESVCAMPIRATPYKHQVSAYNFMLSIYEKQKGVALLCDMGTGKTITTLAAVGTLYGQNKIRRVLIVSPKTIVSVWEEEFIKFADFQYTLAILSGDSYKKIDTLRHLSGETLQIAVVNYESGWRLEDEITNWKPDMIICDESSEIKNPQAKQSKALHRLGKAAKYNAILTGTPITKSPLDFFSQYKFLDDSIFGSSFYSFRAKYAILGGFQKHQIIGYRNMAELVTKAHSVAFRIKLQDAVELPPYIDETRYIQLEGKAKETYDCIERDSYAQLMSGEVCTRNVLTRLLRLSQCTGGFIKDDTDGIVQQISKAKLEALADVLDSCMNENKKVVVFVRFIPEIEAIEKLLRTKKIGYSIITGAVKNRAEQKQRFQEDESVRVFVGQIATTGMGLTLTAASVAVYYSLDFSYENYKQSRARILRIGQSKKCLYIHLLAKGTIDEKIMNALLQKSDIATLLVDEYRKLL